ncbi:MAG: ATP-binding cassette domain-containing protein [Leptospiraceae bacterium]|nr:ATP-binding cassette domain-containing protein [Leptospiraceae bacterium]
MLRVENLTRKFQNKVAVNNISFSVKPGVITGLLGPNGAGKTTTMRLLTGYLEPSSGSIYYGTHAFLEDPITIQQKLGYLPESAPLYPEMLISEYLNYMADIRGVATLDKPSRIEKMVEICELSSHYNTPISFLSKGFKQRVALAGTLIHDPEIIILDEPTSGLDPNQISHIRTLIKGLGKEKTLILSTHILQEVEDICDEVIIINQGNIVANSSVKNLHSGFSVSIQVGAELNQVKPLFAAAPFLSVEEFPEINEAGFKGYLVHMTELKPEVVFATLAKSSLPVRELKVFKRSLESIFEELTRK